MQSSCGKKFNLRTSGNFSCQLFTPQPFGLEGYCRHGSGGRVGSCQTCGTHISVTTWLIFSIQSSVELYRPVVVYCHGHLPIWPIWACPWAKNSSNLPQIGSRLCRMHISETAGWIYPIWNFMDLSWPVVVQRLSYLPHMGFAHGPKTCQMRQHLRQTLRNPYLWNYCMDLYHLKFYDIV